MPRYDIVLFDLDGTLTDSAPGIINCIHYALDSMDVDLPSDEVMRTFLGPPLAETFGGFFGMSEADVALAIDRYRERYHDVGLFENDVYPGIEVMLDSVVEAGSILAVSTSKPTYSATRILEHYSLASRFAFIGGAELDGSRQHKSEVIAHTLEELEARGLRTPDAQVIMAGDREHDVLGAAAHGLPCVGVLWGYGSADELLAAGAVELAADPASLGELLTR